MNTQEKEILIKLKESSVMTQRMLAEEMKISLGKSNKSLRLLKEEGYLNEENTLTLKAEELLQENAPKNAIILAAGYNGMRMIPINTEMPKGMLQVYGEVMIERQIRQLQEAGITDISIVVGFMKESYEYLIDKYGVKLVVNPEYGIKNNLHSLCMLADRIADTYILPCDVWCAENPFRRTELYSWYMVSDEQDEESEVRINRKMELVKAEGGNRMIGIAYITRKDAGFICQRLKEYDKDKQYRMYFWEQVLFQNDKMLLTGRIMDSEKVCEINTYEQLRELDEDSNCLESKVIKKIAGILKVETSDINEIVVLKKGMTNRSFLFSCKGEKYIMRVPGEGTDRLINRKQEYDVYALIKDRKICDDICYINPENGYKLTKYIRGARICDAQNRIEVKQCMQRLRKIHEQGLKVNHTFDMFERIEYYESLWNGAPSCYRDYEETKKSVYELKDYIEHQPKQWGLTHIDSVPDNFLFYRNAEGAEEICLIDWEYAGMQDVHVDIAMFAVYAMYDRESIDALIDDYFTEGCNHEVRRKIYAYIAICGLLWSNWCEYKRQMGIEFGEYSLQQYRYAKEYYRIWKKEKSGNED